MHLIRALAILDGPAPMGAYWQPAATAKEGDPVSQNKLVLPIIPKQPRTTEKSYHTISVRMQENMLHKLEVICDQTGYSRNNLIVRCLDFALAHCEIQDGEN